MNNLCSVTILLVEDDKGHARLIEKNLRRVGIHNPIIHSPLIVILDLNMAKETSPGYDAIVVDYCLPGKSGLEVIKDILRTG